MKLYKLRILLPLLSMLPIAVMAQGAMPLQKRMAALKTAKPNKVIAAERLAASSIAFVKPAGERGLTQIKRLPINKIVVQTPFLETFDTGLGDFTVIDANNDGKTWQFTATESYAGNQGVAFYTYHQKNQANDWLVTPGIKMVKGTEYEISFETWCASTSDKERLEVRYGNEATASALENVLVDGFDVAKKYDDRITVTKKFTPTADGDFYFGFHAMSDPWKFYLFIDNVSIRTVAKASAPAAVENLTATAAPQGQLKATVEFTAPTVDQNGNGINSIDSIRVTRKNMTVRLIKNPVPGSIQTVVDENAEQGNNTYTVVAFAGGHEGKAATASAYVGQDVPEAVDITKSYLHDELPSLTATWEPVSTTGANGGYVDPAKVSYVIARLIQSYNGPVALPVDTTEVAATAYDFNINPDEGEQQMADYLIAPLNVAGLGAFNYIDANTVLIGKPYSLPFKETVDGGGLNGTLWWYSRSSGTAALPVLSSQSHTYGYRSGSIGWKSDGKESMSFNSGKISLGDAVNPVLRYAGKGSHGTISAVAQKQNGDMVKLGQIDLDDEWQTKEISLAGLKDTRYFMMRFVFADDVAGDSLFLDDIHILDAVDKDLQMLATCNDKVKANGELRIGAIVYNAGQKEASGYKVVAKMGDRIILEKEDTPIAPGDVKTYSMSLTPGVFSDAEINISFCVEYNGDEKPDNNSWEKTVAVEQPKSSTVEELSGNSEGSAVLLSWKAPANPSEEVTEDFESYEAWSADSFSPWLCYSNDEALQGGLFSDVQLPYEGQNCAFILTNFDDTYEAGDTYPGHSGYQYLSTFYGVDENGDITGSDKWLISPLLSGKAQTVSFYAKSEAANGVSYPENLILSYSSTTNNPAEFEKADQIKVETLGKWQNYTFSIPDGARYFAIERFDPNGGSLWLGLDDITYIVNCGTPLSYNVYKDRKLYKNVATTTCSVPAEDGNHEYAVTAVYESGESAPVSIRVSTDGINAATVQQAKTETYWTTDGKQIAAPLQKGITIVRTSDGKFIKHVKL